jgi:hypothetical protein
MDPLIIEEDVRSEHLKDTLLLDASKKEGLVHDNTPFAESVNHSLMRWRIASTKNCDPNLGFVCAITVGALEFMLL